MLEITYSGEYKRAIKKYLKSGRFDIRWVENVISKLKKGEKLSEKYKDHQLSGKLQYCRECHIKPNLLLIYRIYKDDLILLLLDLGSHSDLFG